MKVTYFPATKAGRGVSIEKILAEHHIQYDRVVPADRRTRLGKLADLPAVEVDGRVFVNPNDHALRRILEIEPAEIS